MAKRIATWIPLLLASLTFTSVALAQSGGGYDLSWSTIDNGGYTWSEGSGYSLGGTVGQIDAGMLTGERYTLAGGFWSSMLTHYDLSLSTIDGGGYTWSEGGGYSLGGTVGQPDAGALSSGGYTLAGGFWGGTVVRYGVYLPLVLRNYP